MQYEGTRVLLVLAHRKRIARTKRGPNCAIYGAMRRLDSIAQASVGVTVARKYYLLAFQTIANKIHQLEPFDIVLIDEAHLIPRSTQTQYGKTIETLKLMRPTCRVARPMTATIRLDSGYLYQGDGSLFDKGQL